MELIKKPFKIGNSAAVLVPKKWENEKVIVRPLKKSVTKDVLEILNEKDLLKDIKGIYLIGSYAREDADLESDIDILTITNTEKGIINQGSYEINLIPEKNFIKQISKDLYFLASIKEAVPLINESQLKIYKKIKQNINIKSLLNEINSVLKINEDMIESCLELGENVPDGTIYSLVLRLRELYLLKCLILKRRPSKKEFLSYMDRDSYDSYLRIKREQKDLNKISVKKAIKLKEVLKRWLKELRELKKEQSVSKKK